VLRVLGRLRDGGRQCALDVRQGERLREERDRLERARLRALRIDAHEDERQLRLVSPELVCERQRPLARRLEQQHIELRLRVGVDRLVAEPFDDAHEQVSDVVVRLCNRNLRHRLRIGAAGMTDGRFWYETGMNRARVLVVDDEDDVRGLVRELLERAGYTVAEATNGREGLRELYATPPALVILDVNMPDLDGWQTLERIRDLSDVPVLMLTARGGELEKVRGLKAGADDYVTKPFGRQELLARVDALLRRAQGVPEQRATYADGYVSIDYAQRAVSVVDREVRLTPLEFRLLDAFVGHPNQVLSREQLLELVWLDSFSVSGEQVKLYVGYLRRKLAGDSGEAAPIETVRGFGYRYNPPKG
jgi:DNA-binding response OmpR family regulator